MATDRPKRRPIERGLLAASMAIAAGVCIAVWGVTVAVTGSGGVEYPEAVERVDPVPNAVQVLAQTSVFVDFVHGYTGVLVVNGVEIPTVNISELGSGEPGHQVTVPPVTIFEPGNSTLTFTPSAGALVDRFTAGRHEVTVVFWRESEGRGRSSSFTWSFNVM